MMVAGSWFLRAFGEPSTTTKSIQDGNKGGDGGGGAGAGVAARTGENKDESDDLVVSPDSSAAGDGGGGLPTRALAAAAVDFNNMVANHQQQPTRQAHNAGTTPTGRNTSPIMRRNASIYNRLYRPSITTNTTGAAVAVAKPRNTPHSPKGQAAQPPGYANRWKEQQQEQKITTPHRIHTNHRSSTNNNNTSPLSAERKSRLLQKHVLNRHGRKNNTAGGPPVGMVTTTTMNTASHEQQKTAPSSPRKPLHLQSQNELHDVIGKGQHHEDDEQEQLVCDYDTSATVLYELLESSNWEEARNRCRTHPDEVRTWIIRKDKSLKVRWKLLPLHAAIIFQCPNFIVATLLDKHPAAISCVDDQGMLPLHLAFRHKHEDEDLLELLLVNYPQAVLVKDKRDRVPLEHGRDCKFSAKFTRLYADALVTGSAAQTSGGGDPSATVDNATNNNMSPRHGDQVTAKTTMNTSFRMSACGTGAGACTTTTSEQDEVVQWRIQQQRQHDAELRRKREQYEQQQRQHDAELGRIREQYEGQIKQLREQHKLESHEQAVVAKDERHSLMEEHKREVADLRAVLLEHKGRENSLIRDLQTQISELQRSLESSQRDCDQYAIQCGRLESFHAQVKAQLYDIVHDQAAIRDLVLQQERDLESARQMRSQIVRTLMEQEDTDGQNDRVTTEKVMQMGESVRGRIQTLLDNDPMSDSNQNSRASSAGGVVDMMYGGTAGPQKNGTAEPNAASAALPPRPPLPPPKSPPLLPKTSKLQQNANARRHKLQMRGPSRVEMERNNTGGDEEVELIEEAEQIDTRHILQEERKSYHHHQHNHHSSHHHHHNNHNNKHTEHHQSDNRYGRMGNNRLQPESRQDLNDRAAARMMNDIDDEIRESRSLGDNISAITELSP